MPDDMRTNNILKAEQEFPYTFANSVVKDYGILFYNENNKDSNDSNHAVLYPERIGSLEKVISEIRDFYLEKGLEPLIYQPFTEGYFKSHAEIFKKCGYEIKIYGYDKIMLLSAENAIKTAGSLDIRRITVWDDRIAADIYTPDGDNFTPTVIKNAMRDDSYYCFAGYLGDKAAATASVWYTDYGCARLDSVETAKAYRRKGYMRELMSHIVEFHRQMSRADFYLWPANETAERIYTEAGFRLLFQVEAGSARYSKQS